MSETSPTQTAPPEPAAADSYEVLLVLSGGLIELAHNMLESLRRCAVPPERVAIVAARPAIAELGELQRAYGLRNAAALDELVAASPNAPHDRYFDFGSAEFGRFTFYKWLAIKRALTAGIQHVIYSDVDVVWRRNPVSTLRAIAGLYDVAMTTEGDPRFPPIFCTGLMSFRNSRFSHDLLEFMIRLHADVARSEPHLNDQELFNRVVAETPQMLGNIFPLPELVFANGLAAGLMTGSAAVAGIQTGRADPMVFHANWTIGIENKKKMLQATGNWLL